MRKIQKYEISLIISGKSWMGLRSKHQNRNIYAGFPWIFFVRLQDLQNFLPTRFAGLATLLTSAEPWLCLVQLVICLAPSVVHLWRGKRDRYKTNSVTTIVFVNQGKTCTPRLRSVLNGPWPNFLSAASDTNFSFSW